MKSNLIKIAILLAIVLALAGTGLAFAAFNIAPTPQDILNRAASTLQAANDGHAVLQVNGKTSDKTVSATVEIWAKKVSGGTQPNYAFRAQVNDSNDPKTKGDVAVSDGTTFWSYSPSENTVSTGSVEQIRQSQSQNGGQGTSIDSPQALVQKLFDVSTVTLAGTESVQNHSSYKLQVIPTSGKAPASVIGATGSIWIDTDRWVPLQATFSGGSAGQGTVTATMLDLNQGVTDDHFRFQVPPGAKVVSIADRLPQHITLSAADQAAGFKVLKPSYVPAGATLVDVFKVGKAIVQRYEAGQGSFSIGQNVQDTGNPSRGTGTPTPVRNTTGTLYTSKDGKSVLLEWTENGQTFTVGGVLSGQDVVKIAQSLQ